MTIAATPRRSPVYTGNGVATTYAFSFKVLDATTLVVTVADENDLNSAVLVNGVDYTVTLNLDQDASPGGEIAYASLPVGHRLVVTTNTDYSQPTAITNLGSFHAHVLEGAMDRIVIQQQQQEEKLARTLQVPVTSETDPTAYLQASLTSAANSAAAAIASAAAAATSETNAALSAGQVADATALRGDLANGADAARGAALVALNGALAYSAGTVGWALRAAAGGTNVLRYMPVSEWADLLAGTSTRDCAAELAAAIAAEDHLFFPCWVPINSTVVLRSNITLSGVDRARGGIKGLANTFSLLSDNNVALSNVTIRDMGFNGGSSGSSNRGLLFDADTASQSQNIRIERCRFSNLFRGAELDRVAGLEFVDCVAESLDSSLLYVGETTGTGRSSKVNVRGARVDGGDIVDVSGGGCVVVSHADGVTVADVELNAAGASAGAANLFHGVYLRSCTDARVSGLRSQGHRRGAVLHVYADTGAGEPTSKRVNIRDIVADEQQHYAAVRVEAADGVVISDVQADRGYTQALYLTNITGLSVANVSGRNNNRERLTGTTNALLKLENIVRAHFANVLGIDDDTGSGQYGQGTLFTLTGTNSEIQWDNVQMRFPGGGAIGYYVIDLASGTLNRFAVRGLVQDGASSPFNEGGTATGGAFNNIVMVNTGSPSALTFAQLHKFQCRDVRIGGSAWPYVSDGWYITAQLSNQPASGDWREGDTVWRTAPVSGFTPGWRCVTAGTPGTWKAMASLA